MRRKQKTDPADAEGAELVDEYVERFSANRGLQPTYPRLAIGMMPELNGWPVRNADGGGNIAYFTSYDAAEKALANSYREFRGIASGRRSATKRKRSYASRSKSGGAKRRTVTRLRHVRAAKRRGYGVMKHGASPRSYAKENRAADTPGARFTKCWECDKEDWCLKRKLKGRDLNVHLCDACARQLT